MKRVRLSQALVCTVPFFCGTGALAASDDSPKIFGKQIAPAASSWTASVPTYDGDFNSTAIASFDPRVKNLLRLETNWTKPLDGGGQWLRFGDTVSQPGSWGNAVRYAGVQFGSLTDVRSDLLSSDRLALTGVSVLPTAADAMLAQAPVTPIRDRGVSVNGKTAVSGINSLSFSARDAMGRTNTFTRSLLAPASSAAPVGCKQFSLGVGKARMDYAIASNNYGSLFANSTVVCGTDSGYTVEAHGEYLQGDAGLAGVDVRRSIGNLGTASLAFAGSQSETDGGWLVRAGLQRNTERFEVNLRARLQSAEFREIGSPIESDPLNSRILASVGAKLSDNHTLALAYANQTTMSAKRIDVVAMTQTINLGNKGSKGKLSIVADRAVKDDTNSSVKVYYVRPLKD